MNGIGFGKYNKIYGSMLRAKATNLATSAGGNRPGPNHQNMPQRYRDNMPTKEIKK